MATAPSWLHICRHSAQQHAWQISDGQRTMACHMSHCRLAISANERDEAKVQSIQRRLLSSRGENVDLLMVHLLRLFSKVPGITPAQNLSEVVWINSEKESLDLTICVLGSNRGSSRKSLTTTALMHELNWVRLSWLSFESHLGESRMSFELLARFRSENFSDLLALFIALVSSDWGFCEDSLRL